jgi:hypothetical protein
MAKKKNRKNRTYTARQLKLTEVLRARTKAKDGGDTSWIKDLPELPEIGGEKKAAVVIPKKG